MIFYYSGCGNSRWVAEELAAGLQEQVSFIPDLQREGMNEYSIAEGERIGFVFPIYAWGAPKLVEDFVQQVTWQGKADYVWFACTCGDEMGYAHRDFKKTLSQAGLELSGTFCFIMPETYLCYPGFHLDTKENADRKTAMAREKMPWVIEQIAGKKEVVDQVVGSVPGIKSGLIRPGFVKYMSDKKYRTTEACNGCGTCAKKCPLHNIVMKDGRPEWQGNCTQCMACYHYCPKNAVQYGKATRGKGQYHF